MPSQKSFQEKGKFKLLALPVAVTFLQVNHTFKEISLCSHGLPSPMLMKRALVGEPADFEFSGACDRQTAVLLGRSPHFGLLVLIKTIFASLFLSIIALISSVKQTYSEVVPGHDYPFH
ncbi:MAG: hypothetical protein VX696_04635 [Pseudomonadota bacterium]|nr:hypothetical protein [Pseudomonadota bacterium]